MPIIQGGVMDDREGGTIRTKKELKELAKERPHTVEFFATSSFDGGSANRFPLTRIPIGTKLVIVGPNPYTKRDWYANIEVTASGEIKVT